MQAFKKISLHQRTMQAEFEQPGHTSQGNFPTSLLWKGCLKPAQPSTMLPTAFRLNSSESTPN